MPDLATVFDEAGAEGDNAMARARDQLLDTVTDAVTRSFRPAFGIAAVLAALAAIPTLLVAGRGSHGRVWPARRRRVSTIGIGVLSVAAVGLLGTEVVPRRVVRRRVHGRGPVHRAARSVLGRRPRRGAAATSPCPR